MWDLKQWSRTFQVGICHSTTSAARRAHSLRASQTTHLWGEPCIPKWSSRICRELLSPLTSDPLLRSLPTHCCGCSTGTAHSKRDFRMTHWIIKMSMWSIPFTKGHGWSPFRPERGTVNHSKRNMLYSPTPQLPPALPKSSFCYAGFFQSKKHTKWAVFPRCYRRVSGLRLPLIKPWWTLISPYQLLALKWVLQSSYIRGLKCFPLQITRALRNKSVCAGTHYIKFMILIIFNLPSTIGCEYHTIKHKHPLPAVWRIRKAKNHPPQQKLLFSHTRCHLRWCDRSVSLLSCCVPYLSLYCLPINLNASCCKLYSNGAFAFQVKLIASESRQKVTLAYSRVSNKYNYKTKMA